jgi:acyl carrier protein
MKEVEKRIQSVMATVFDVDPTEIDENSSQDSIESWDSLKHLDLVVALEGEFDITIPLEEVGNMLTFKLISIIVQEQLDKK